MSFIPNKQIFRQIIIYGWPLLHRGGITKFSHISSFMRNSLHWLSIHQRIQFCSLMWNCLTGSAPQWPTVSQCHIVFQPTLVHLDSPRTGTSMAQSMSFAIVCPSNYLSPLDLKTFSLNRLTSSASTWKPQYFVSEDTEPRLERLWFKWRYVNIWLRLRYTCTRTQNVHFRF